MAVGKVVKDMITDSAVVEAKLGVGTTTGTAIGQWHIDQISINGDTISTTSNNNLVLFPDNTGKVGVNTSSLASTLTGIGNSFQGIYVSNGMMIMDNTLNGNHYIGTTYNGLMAGPVRIEGTLSIDGNYVVV